MLSVLKTTFDDDGIFTSQIYEEKVETEYPLYTFNIDILSLVTDMHLKGKDPGQMYDILKEQRTSIACEEAKELATTIRRYFRNKIMLNRLKDEYISEYIDKLDDILNEPFKISEDKLNVLVTIPRIYFDNINIEAIMNSAKSVADRRGSDYNSNEPWTFIKKLERNSKSHSSYNYFFKNKDNHVLNLVVPKSQNHVGAWDYIVKQGTINIRGLMITEKVKGYDFHMYKLLSGYEIY